MNTKVQAAASEVEQLTLELANRRRQHRTYDLPPANTPSDLHAPADLNVSAPRNATSPDLDKSLTPTMDKLGRAAGVTDL